MAKRFVLEISVQTVEAARAAERGGADRIELCADLSVGGLTPSPALMRKVRQSVAIPVFSMIRPRARDFIYSAEEFAEMKRAIRLARESAMHGLVFGILRKDHTVDVERTRELVGLAEPLAVTFHRAFDECTDLRRSLEEVIATGAARILTSGAARSALEGASRVQELVQAARDRIIILPGAGISARNIAEVVAETRAREFHSGLSAALPYSSCDYRRFQSEVENLAKALAGLA